MNITWNVQKFTSDFSFVHKYGEGVMQLLDLPEGATHREAALAAESALCDQLFRDGKWYADYVRLRMKAVKPL